MNVTVDSSIGTITDAGVAVVPCRSMRGGATTPPHRVPAAYSSSQYSGLSSPTAARYLITDHWLYGSDSGPIGLRVPMHERSTLMASSVILPYIHSEPEVT